MHCKMIPPTKVNKLLYLVDLSGQQARLYWCSDSELHAWPIPGDSHLEPENAASLWIGTPDHIYFVTADTLIKGIGSQAHPSAHIEILRTISRVHLHVSHYRTPFVLQGAARCQEWGVSEEVRGALEPIKVCWDTRLALGQWLLVRETRKQG